MGHLEVVRESVLTGSTVPRQLTLTAVSPQRRLSRQPYITDLHADRLVIHHNELEEPGGDHVKWLQLQRHFLAISVPWRMHDTWVSPESPTERAELGCFNYRFSPSVSVGPVNETANLTVNMEFML